MKRSKVDIKLIPAAFVLGFIPLIVRLRVYDSGFEAFDWYPAAEDGIMYDFFLWYKAAAVIITAAVMLFIILRGRIGKKNGHREWKKMPELLCLAAYMAMVLISGLLSSYKTGAFFGTAELFESVPVILAYGIFFIYAAEHVRDEDSIKTLIKLSAFGVFTVLIIGFLQFVSKDPFSTAFVKSLILPAKYSSLKDSLSFTFDPGIVYGTFYNTNYVIQYAGFGIFVGLALAVCAGLAVRWRIAGAAAAVLSFVLVLGSDSRTGKISVAAALFAGCLFVLWIFFNKKLPEKINRRAGIAVLLLIVVVSGIVIAGKTGLLGKGMVGTGESASERAITDIETGKEYVQFTINGSIIRISYEVTESEFLIHLSDDEGKEPEYRLTENGSEYILTDSKYSAMLLTPVYIDDRLCLKVKADWKELVFSDFGEEEGYLYLNKAGNFTTFKNYEKSGFFDDSLFSDRGLIWNFCLKLLPKNIIKGCGANNFVYAYPNDDDMSKLYSDKDIVFFDVKAHSMYFQQAVENGCLSLVFFLAFYLIYFVKTLRLLTSSSERTLSFCMAAGIFLGSICYMISGLTVDSNVTTAPVFWILMGVGSGLYQRSSVV